jgi:uncharacterized integral membrane protein (TIGR00698 family)
MMQTLTSMSSPTNPSWAAGRAVLPGLLMTTAIASVALVLRASLGFTAVSPLIIAIILGLVFHNVVGTPAAFKPGVAFSVRRVLRLAVILLGLQLSVSQLTEVGSVGLGIIAATLAATFLFTMWLGRVFGVDGKLVELIAAGTSICGASAVVSANTITRASDEDVAYAIACVTVFGSASVLLYPSFEGLIALTPHAYGLWAGASIHEVAQVVAAAFQNSLEAGKFGTIAKLSRVMLLAPVILALGYVRDNRLQTQTETPSRKLPVPWFVLGFIAMMLINSLDLIPHREKVELVQATTFLLMIALAAIGFSDGHSQIAGKRLETFTGRRGLMGVHLSV